MNSRLMLLLAGLLVLAATIVGYLGYRTTADARTAAEEAERKAANAMRQQGPEGKTAVVSVSRPVQAFQVLVAEDLAVDYLTLPPPNTFTDPQLLVGRPVQTDIAAGTLLEASHFNPGGKVSRLLKPGERALAIPVNEIVGGGGFVQPGDFVDIVLYLAGAEGKAPTSQVVMRAVRVLSFGESLVSPEPRQPVEGEAPPSERKSGSTAVLAVSQVDVTKLMLATTLGELRLAIVPAEEMKLSADWSYTADALSGKMPDVDMLPVPARPSAVPVRRNVQTASFLDAAPAPRSVRPKSAKSVAGASNGMPTVVIIRGLSTEVGK